MYKIVNILGKKEGLQDISCRVQLTVNTKSNNIKIKTFKNCIIYIGPLLWSGALLDCGRSWVRTLSGHTKDKTVGFCCLADKHAALHRKVRK